MKKFLTMAAMAALVCAVSCKKNNEPVKYDPISASPQSVTLEGDGSSANVAVQCSEATFTATTDAKWLTVEVNGKEVVLTATANNTKAERSTNVTIKDSKTSCDVEVIQPAGSIIPGYTSLKTVAMDYSGTMMYMFSKPLTEDYGGMAFIEAEDMDGNAITVIFYTPLYYTEEEVEFPEGVYSVGKDKMLEFYAVPFTWIPATPSESEDDGEYAFGTQMTTTDGSLVMFTSGTMEYKDGILKFDFTDDKGNEYKYAFDDVVPVDTEEASYPSEKEDPTQNIHKVVCTYEGLNEDESAASLSFCMYSGEDTENPNMIFYSLNYAPKAFAEIDDLSGLYMSPETEEEAGAPMTINIGMFQSFIWYNSSDIFTPAFGALNLTKNEDGTYSIMGTMADESYTEMYMFMATLPIEFTESSAEEE